MSRETDRTPEGYVFEVRDNTRRYINHLLLENEKLQLLVNSLQSELDARESMVDQLRSQVDEVESQKQRFNEEYVRIERQNNDLANLYVASHRLHTTLDHQEVLAVIREIVANLIGSEELVLFELDAAGTSAVAIASMGLEPERLEALARDIASGVGVIARVASSGKRFIGNDEGMPARTSDEADLTACVPFEVGGRVTGLLAVFRLLQQKDGLEPLDFELLELLASHAGIALYRADRLRPPPPQAG